MDNQQLIFLLSNPFTFGALLSWFCEQLSWFTWALLLFSLDKNALPTTAMDWKIILVNTLAVVVSSQVTNVLLPGFVDLLKNLKAVPVTVTATTANTSTYTNGSMTTTTSATGQLPPESKIEDKTASLPVPDVKLGIPPYHTSDGTAVG
jgi:heme/copper-type cytochrome/quinol oxidase subunit 3